MITVLLSFSVARYSSCGSSAPFLKVASLNFQNHISHFMEKVQLRNGPYDGSSLNHKPHHMTSCRTSAASRAKHLRAESVVFYLSSRVIGPHGVRVHVYIVASVS